jgi:hypothetical protein
MPCTMRASSGAHTDPCFTAARVAGREMVFVASDSGEYVRAVGNNHTMVCFGRVASAFVSRRVEVADCV